ncbi:hypothetical protein AAT19DRAFT_10050 [Rhodotorula toruloides]|uniref:Uncharacterized protein n=1 Tax=Rhodotorula toruloides TaxID=5286 RepID=A0A2T0A1R6_RHOTO|nr:hypothetical protein AAT19DRAFT_10050 [Rhodotorula toruloides]
MKSERRRGRRREMRDLRRGEGGECQPDVRDMQQSGRCAAIQHSEELVKGWGATVSLDDKVPRTPSRELAWAPITSFASCRALWLPFQRARPRRPNQPSTRPAIRRNTTQSGSPSTVIASF